MSRILELTNRLSDLLGRASADRSDFVALAVVGESQRQALALCDEAPPGAAAMQARWLSRLREIAGDSTRGVQVTFSDLDQDLATAWRQLEEAAQMDVATVCTRVGWLQRPQLGTLASRAEDESRRLAPRLSMLWERAHLCQTNILPDPEYPGSQSWLEPLARFSSMRTALVVASHMFSPQKRAQIVERVMDRIAASKQAALAPSPKGAPDPRGAWAALKAALAPAPVRAPARGRVPVTAFVRSYCGQVLDLPALASLRHFVENLAVVPVPGAGVPVTAASPQMLEREMTIGGGIDVDIHVQWTPAGISLTYRVEPPQPGALVLLLEDPENNAPLASVAMPSDVDGRKECSVTTAELGFDPTARPWHLRVMLA
jgi:hypothetical protein